APIPPAPSRSMISNCGNSLATSDNGGGSKCAVRPPSPASVSAPWASKQAGHNPASAPAGRGLPQFGHGLGSFKVVLIAFTRSLPTPEAFLGRCYSKSLVTWPIIQCIENPGWNATWVLNALDDRQRSQRFPVH